MGKFLVRQGGKYDLWLWFNGLFNLTFIEKNFELNRLFRIFRNMCVLIIILHMNHNTVYVFGRSGFGAEEYEGVGTKCHSLTIRLT